MNKNTFAPTPPMGWNSYDYYDTAVTEAQVKANADYMAAHLKQFGWEYIVVDIEWYAYGAGSRRAEYQYIPFGQVAMDEYSRLLPCEERFPSAAGGRGFGPLASYVHEKGLKFGIHIMRGIPRAAAHAHTPIKAVGKTAADIADAYSICPWNPDMYGVKPGLAESQAYYDSLLELYAEWGVDYIKCDDICRYDAASAEAEIIMLHRAIEKCGRRIVLSLSPGPALPAKAWIYEKYANLWRITDDLWDNWESVKHMFERCEVWQNHVSTGCYPDCDMIPFGTLGKGFGQERTCNLTYDEQRTLMTLWCIFRSPLMLGCELTKLDERTLSLITNNRVLHLISHSHGARQILRDDEQAIWVSLDDEDGSFYVALFNLGEEVREMMITGEEMEEILEEMGEHRSIMRDSATITDLWSGERASAISGNVPAHGAMLYRVE